MKLADDFDLAEYWLIIKIECLIIIAAIKIKI